MFSKNSRLDSELDRITNHAVRLINKLFLHPTDPKFLLDGLEEVRQLLDCMPLGTSDYRLAMLRIDNAERFLASEEIGAAKYEIRMLAGGLRQHFSVGRWESSLDQMVLPARSTTRDSLTSIRFATRDLRPQTSSTRETFL